LENQITKGAAMRNTRFEVRPTSGALGAELLGIDLSQALDADAVADIRQAFNEHGVIFFATKS
jgi:taurine dioxygenase